MNSSDLASVRVWVFQEADSEEEISMQNVRESPWYYHFCKGKKGREGSRIEQREKLDSDSVSRPHLTP